MKENRDIKILLIIVTIVILIAGGLLAYKIIRDRKSDNAISLGEEVVVEEKKEKKKESEEQPKTFAGTDRAIAVMIDNHAGARPQAGLNDASLVYEIIVEGGMTRLMPVFKGVSLDKIGPVRSSRHYFLDYALENDAIYVHYGWSPQAQADIQKLKVNNINGISESSSSFWRVTDKSSPHNVVTATDKIKAIAERNGYNTTSDRKSVLNYVVKEVNLKEMYKKEEEKATNTTVNEATTETQSTEEIVKNATNITIPYSPSYKVKYEYNPETKRYTRFANNVQQNDWTSKEPVTTKNIIITFCANTTLNDGENKGRQTLSNVGSLKGYYITNGEAIEITATKMSRTSQTVYKDLKGNIIKVNDGNTFINICPIDAQVSIGE